MQNFNTNNENHRKKRYVRMFHEIRLAVRKKVQGIVLLDPWPSEELWNRGGIRWRERETSLALHSAVISATKKA